MSHLSVCLAALGEDDSHPLFPMVYRGVLPRLAVNDETSYSFNRNLLFQNLILSSCRVCVFAFGPEVRFCKVIFTPNLKARLACDIVLTLLISIPKLLTQQSSNRMSGSWKPPQYGNGILSLNLLSTPRILTYTGARSHPQSTTASPQSRRKIPWFQNRTCSLPRLRCK